MNSKGLSSVVGAVLLIMISVGAAASAWGFMDTLLGNTQDSVENRVEEDNQASQADLSGEIAYESSDGFIIYTVRNTGSNTLLVRDDGEKRMNLYVRGRPVNNDPKSWEFYNNPKDSLQPQESLTINTTHVFPPQGEGYSLELNGPYETSATYVCYNSGTSSC